VIPSASGVRQRIFPKLVKIMGTRVQIVTPVA
jgi:hypothetical protein